MWQITYCQCHHLISSAAEGGVDFPFAADQPREIIGRLARMNIPKQTVGHQMGPWLPGYLAWIGQAS